MVSLGVFSVATDRTMCPGVDSASKNEYQDISGGKDGRCVRVTSYHVHSAESLEKTGGLNLPDPQGPAQACSGKIYL